MKNWDITLAQLPLIVVGGYYIYQAIMYFQEHMRHPSGTPTSTFVFLITIGIVLLSIALGLQEIRRYRAKKEAPIVQKTATTKEVVMIPCEHCGALMPQTSFCPECGARRKG